MIAHLVTEIKTLFAELDADGNLVREIPVQARLTKLSADEWERVGSDLLVHRDELVRQASADAQRKAS